MQPNQMPFKILLKAFFVGFISFIFSANAQMFPSNNGFAVNFAGDTLKGEIIILNSYQVKFKPVDKKEYIFLNPNEINVVVKGNDIYYHSEELPFLGNNNKVFIRELISGDVAFYEFSDSNNVESYYVKKRDDKFRKLNTMNYNTLKKSLLLNCDSIPSKKIGVTSDLRFNMVADQIAMHNASCSTIENPFKVKYSKKRVPKFLVNVGYSFDYISIPKYSLQTYYIYSLGFGTYFAITKNLVYSPEISLNIRDFGQYSSSSGKFFPLFSEIMPLAILYRTNKFKINPNIMGGLTLKFPLANATKYTYAYTIGVGADAEISKDLFLRLHLRYFNVNFIRPDESSYILPFNEDGIQYVLSIIF